MERIIVIGCGGAGKSTLARQMGEKLGLPVVHLDQIWWSPGNWNHISEEDFDRRILEEMEKPQWILDGNFNRTLQLRLEKCDAVVYLDLPRLVCLFRWIGRVIKNWGHHRADMAEGCKEWFDLEFAVWIWRFNRKNRKRYYQLLGELEGKAVYILRSPRAVKKFLHSLP